MVCNLKPYTITVLCLIKLWHSSLKWFPAWSCLLHLLCTSNLILTLKQPALVRKKKSMEIHFIYLRNREICCIFIGPHHNPKRASRLLGEQTWVLRQVVTPSHTNKPPSHVNQPHHKPKHVSRLLGEQTWLLMQMATASHINKPPAHVNQTHH